LVKEMPARDNLIEAFEYLQHLDKLRVQPTTQLSTHKLPIFHESTFVDLPGIETDLMEGDTEVWLLIRRLRTESPPEPHTRLKPWISLPNDPAKEPSVADTISVESEQLPPNDVHASPDQPPSHIEPRLEDEPEIQALFESYVTDLWEPWSRREKPRRQTIFLYDRLFSLMIDAEIGGSAEDGIEMAWGIGIALWDHRESGKTITYPLISRTVEIHIDQQTMSILVAPTERDPLVHTDIFNALGLPHADDIQTGEEDEDIHEFFRRSAFPDERDVNAILDVLAASDGLSLPQIQAELNLRHGQIEKVLNVLSVETPAPLIKDGSRWHRTPVHYRMDHERIHRLTEQRECEWQEILDYVDSRTFLMAFLRNALDDPEATECGKCAVCRGEPVVGLAVDREVAVEAGRFLRHAEMTFSPKKKVDRGAFPTYSFLYGPRGSVPQSLRAEDGRILSRWGDAGWGGLVADDKHTGHFRDELVEAAAEMVRERWLPDPAPQWVACVPSRNHPTLVPEFARRLAVRLDLPFVDAIGKVRDNEPQKMQQNRFHQCRNLDGVFEVAEEIPSGPMLLVDDAIDSGWTVTVLAALLRRAGSGPVFPVALASTTSGD
jgi:hypothetical protein